MCARSEGEGYYGRQGWKADYVETMSRFFDLRDGTRIETAGPMTLRGVAFAGDRGVSRVEVSTDGGRTWRSAALDYNPSPIAWTLWSLPWRASAGEHVLVVRAVDGAGRPRPRRRGASIRPARRATTGSGSRLAERLALVTGGAGLIGSHLVRSAAARGLVRCGCSTTSSRPPTAARSPAWIDPRGRLPPGRRARRRRRARRARGGRGGLPSGRLRRLHARDREVRRGQQPRHGATAGDRSATRTCRCERSSSPRRRPSTARGQAAAREHGSVFPEPRDPPSACGPGEFAPICPTLRRRDGLGRRRPRPRPDRRRERLRDHQGRPGTPRRWPGRGRPVSRPSRCATPAPTGRASRC